MKLHTYPEDFQDLITIVAVDKHIPEAAVRRDYFIVMMLQKLSCSQYADQCVFKGGTSLSKCFPGTIERFSEDIDLTFWCEDLTTNQRERALKRIEAIMSEGGYCEPIVGERSPTNKASHVWFTERNDSIKLEIGSKVQPEPASKKTVKTYIHEYLEKQGLTSAINEYGLKPVEVYVLDVERTFVDKVYAVRRHAICGTLEPKVRHVYDVTRLFAISEIQTLLSNRKELKRLVELTKESSLAYADKRLLPEYYDPQGVFGFDDWKDKLDDRVKGIYESLHLELLYTDEKQDFELALETFQKISDILVAIDE